MRGKCVSSLLMKSMTKANTQSYTIETISRDSVDVVIDIQEELAIGDKLLRDGITVAPRGMLISGHNKEALQHYLDEGGKIFVASAEEQYHIGYTLVAPGRVFTPKYLKSKVNWVNHDWRGKITPIIEGNNYIYLDQIGVRWKYHRKGVASALLRHVEKVYDGQDIIVLIITSPLYNISSAKFFKNHNYVKICDIHFSKFGTLSQCDGLLVWKR